MPTPELFPLFIEPLNRASLRYMVTGSLAAIAYGEPRLTLDVDLVLELAPTHLPALMASFPSPAFYCPPLDVLLLECARPQRGHLNLIHADSGLKADVYLAGRDPLHAWAMQRRCRLEIEDLVVWFAPVEYVIVRKLQYYQEGRSEKHLHDLRGILRCSADRLDLPWLHETIAQLGLAPAWSLCQTPES